MEPWSAWCYIFNRPQRCKRMFPLSVGLGGVLLQEFRARRPRNLLMEFWLRGLDLNQRPLGYAR